VSAGHRWRLEDARAVAAELVELLGPFCERLVVAGSVRRGKVMVGDVELVYAPKCAELQNLLGEVDEVVSLVDAKTEALVKDGVLAKRRNVNGSQMWGAKNKLAVHVKSGMPVDLFATDLRCFENYLVCRTGPGDLNTEIATRAKAMGLKWHPYGDGFEGLADGGWVKVTQEADVFATVGMPWMEPEIRGAWREVVRKKEEEILTTDEHG
jgi:DNA polymerase/3'-5' exonuclease PolX